ncbi:MBL fold metallo-hydrolase [Thermopolyspora sp. NPDC052614]|uniref:MBL fold metallo-hydrolase n=1 Tax=Thermopolyspora sp. NPDC052614 TaxID=3155682 RepID=UPI00342F238D
MESGNRTATDEQPGAPAGPEPGRFIEVAEGVYAWIQRDGTWWINNAGLVAGDQSMLLVDTCTTERRTRELLAEVAGVSAGRPLRYAVNTHHHGDHTFGNSLLPEETCLIGHHQMRESLLADRTLLAFPPYWTPTPDFGDLTPRVPTLTIQSDVSVHLGDRHAELLHPGYAAHTYGDVIVWVPDVRVLFAGDLLFPGHTPMLLAGAPSGAIRVLDWIASFDAETIVPGHGEVIERARIADVLDEHRRYYEFVVAAAAKGMAAGLTPLEVARTTDLGEFADLLDPERFVLNVHSAYAEHAGERANRAGAFKDALTWLGAPLHTKV